MSVRGVDLTLADTDREALLDSLPGRYGRALRLRDRGLTDAEIAHRVEIETEAVASMIALGEAKLARLMTDHASGRPSQLGSSSRQVT